LPSAGTLRGGTACMDIDVAPVLDDEEAAQFERVTLEDHAA
jgi:hypothetical protein